MPLSPSAEWPLSSAEHTVMALTHSWPLPAWCPVSQLTPPGTALLPRSRLPGLMILHQKKKCWLFLALLLCVCVLRRGWGVVMETSCKSTRVPSNFVFLVLLWPGSSGAPRRLGHLSFSRAFIVPELWSLPNNLIMAKLSWTTSTKLPHSVCFS